MDDLDRFTTIELVALHTLFYTWGARMLNRADDLYQQLRTIPTYATVYKQTKARWDAMSAAALEQCELFFAVTEEISRREASHA